MPHPPHCVEVIMQKDGADCCVAALASLSGKPYRQVSDAAVKVVKRVHKRGLWTSELLRIARTIGYPLQNIRLRGQPPPEDGTGLLTISRPEGSHCVLLYEGIVVNPSDGLLWSVDAYLALGWRTVGFHPPA